jgi:hypothetical protein
MFAVKIGPMSVSVCIEAVFIIASDMLQMHCTLHALAQQQKKIILTIKLKNAYLFV